MASARRVSSRTRAVSSDRYPTHGLGCYPSTLWSGSRTRAASCSSSAFRSGAAAAAAAIMLEHGAGCRERDQKP